MELQIDIDGKSGFCFGVVAAIDRVQSLLDDNQKVYCVGDVVHNEEEIKRLEEKGMITISHTELRSIHDSVVLFRAHGEPPESYEIARSNGNQVFDATCKIILNIQKKIKESYNNGEFILIFGKKNHPEVIGINGQIENKGLLYEKIEDLPLDQLPAQVTVYSQTTMSLEDFYRSVDYLKANGIQVNMKDTICRQVCNRHDDLILFSKEKDVVVFVAGKNSSNGKVLYGICRSANEHAYFISSEKEVESHWFRDGQKVGICGATSTPRWLMEKVVNKIKSL